MDDKLQILYNNLKKDGYDLPDFGVFKTDMADPQKSQKLHTSLLKDGYDLPDYNTFMGDMDLKKKNISETSTTPVESSSIPQQPLSSDEALQKSTNLQPSSTTRVNIQAEPNIPKVSKEKERFGGSDWITATAGEIDKSFAKIFRSIDELVPQINIIGAPSSPIGALADFFAWAGSKGKELPSGKGVKGIVGGVLKGTADIIPDITFATLTPELALPSAFAKIGLTNIGKFGTEQALRGLVDTSEESQNEPLGKRLSMPIVSALERGMTGWMFEGLGETSAEWGSKLANKLIPNVATTTQAIDKALTASGTSMLSNSLLFAGYGGLDEFVRTGKITSENLYTSAGMGISMGGWSVGKLLAAKGINTILAMPKEGFHDIMRSTSTAQDLMEKAQAKAGTVDNGTSINREGDAVMAFMLSRAAQVKATADEIRDNPDGIKKIANDSDLDPKVKEAIVDKIDEITHDNDPRYQAIKEQTDKIAEIDAKLGEIKKNKALSDVERDNLSAPLKEQREALKNEANERYNSFKGEPLKLGDKEFKDKQELFNYLNKNAVNEKGDMTYGLPNEGEYPNITTIRAIDEWTKAKNEELKQSKQNIGGTENAKTVMRDYVETWANDVLKNKGKLVEEIKTDFDMVLTKLKNLDLIKTDCI